jgi:hypothetical protein
VTKSDFTARVVGRRGRETPAEQRFKLAVIRLVLQNEYPSPGNIERALGRHVTHNINGRECRWRREVMTAMGWTYHADTALIGRTTQAFTPPEDWA